MINSESNKNEPLSLRSVGAFTIHGSQIYEKKCELTNWDGSELEKCVDEYLKHFYQTIQAATMESFEDNIQATQYHRELRESLTFIHNQQYLEALNCLKDSDDGYFRNGEIDINNAIRELCKNNIENNEYMGTEK